MEFDDDLIAPIERWARSVDEADILDGPEDFLVGYGAACRSIERLLEGRRRSDAGALSTALAACEFIMAENPGWTERAGLEPIQPLSPEWLVILDDGSAEFRLAAALNSLRPVDFDAAKGPRIRPFRSHLEPVEVRWRGEGGRAGAISVDWDFSALPKVDWDREEDIDGLNAIFRRRLKMWDSAPEDFTRGAVTARPEDLRAFLTGETDEAKLSRLAFSLSLVDAWRLSEDPLDNDGSRAVELDEVYALARLCYTGHPLGPEGGDGLPLNRDIHLLAHRGDADSVIEFACAHLREHGYPVSTTAEDTPLDVRRIAAALLFPISPATRRYLAHRVGLSPR